MSDTESTTTEQAQVEGETPTQEPKTEATGFDTSTVKPETVDSLPEFAQRMIRELREENAKRRTQVDKAAEGAAQKAKEDALKQYNELSTQYEAALNNAKKAELEYAKLETALSVGVEPTKAKAFAARLRGETPDELVADARELIEVFGSQESPRRGDPSQGRVNSAPQGSGLFQLIQESQR